MHTTISKALAHDLRSPSPFAAQLYDKISDYLKLRNDITVMQQAELTSVKTLVDLGCNVYCLSLIHI